MPDYGRMTSDDFDRHLRGVVSAMDPLVILMIPGVYEILAEELNNEVLANWEDEQADLEDEEDEDASDANDE